MFEMHWGSISAPHLEDLKGKFHFCAANKLGEVGCYAEKFNLQHERQTFRFWRFNDFLDF